MVTQACSLAPPNFLATASGIQACRSYEAIHIGVRLPTCLAAGRASAACKGVPYDSVLACCSVSFTLRRTFIEIPSLRCGSSRLQYLPLHETLSLSRLFLMVKLLRQPGCHAMRMLSFFAPSIHFATHDAKNKQLLLSITT